jgi:hypothetical protein
MPKAELPTTLKGWFIAATASFVGFISGFVTIAWLRKVWK